MGMVGWTRFSPAPGKCGRTRRSRCCASWGSKAGSRPNTCRGCSASGATRSRWRGRSATAAPPWTVWQTSTKDQWEERSMARRLNRRQVLALGGVSLAAAVAACQSQAIEVPTKAPAGSGGGAPPPTQAPAAGATPAATAAAAGGATPAAPAATKPAAATPAAGATAQAAPQSVGSIANVPREQTVIWSVSDELNQFADTGIFNPFLQGARRTGWHFAFEPLYFYNPYWTDEYTAPPGLKGAKGEIPYQAESYAYNAD